MVAKQEPFSSSEDDAAVAVPLLEYGPSGDIAKAIVVADGAHHALDGGVFHHSDGTEGPLTPTPLESTRGTESVATSVRAAEEAAWVQAEKEYVLQL